jgi:neutral trehalase
MSNSKLFKLIAIITVIALTITLIININGRRKDTDSYRKFTKEFIPKALEANIFSFPIRVDQDLYDPKTKQTITEVYAPTGTPTEKVSLNPAVKVVYFTDKNELELNSNALLYLPKPYLIAGSFHNEAYPHDTSYTIDMLLTLIKEGYISKTEKKTKYLNLIKDQLEDFAYEAKYYDYPLNGNRAYFIPRSQASTLVSNVKDYYEITQDKEWLKETGLPLAKNIVDYWTQEKVFLDDQQKYFGFKWFSAGEGQCYELMQSYAEHDYFYHKIRDQLAKYQALQANNPEDLPHYARGFDYSKVLTLDNTSVPTLGSIEDFDKLKSAAKPHKINNSDNPDKLSMKENLDQNSKTASNLENNSKKSTDLENFSKYNLTNFYYYSDRLSKVSGYDTNSIYGPFNAFAADFIPADHNLKLYKSITDLVSLLYDSGIDSGNEVSKYQKLADELKASLNKYLWDDEKGFYFEYDSANSKLRNEYGFISSAYALWAHIYDVNKPAELDKLAKTFSYITNNFNGAKGLWASNVETGIQWDKPYVWPVQQGMVVKGLIYYAHRLNDADIELAQQMYEFAVKVAAKYVDSNFNDWQAANGKSIKEKVTPDEETLFTGYATGENYTWNMATVMYFDHIMKQTQ